MGRPDRRTNIVLIDAEALQIRGKRCDRWGCVEASEMRQKDELLSIVFLCVAASRATRQ